MSEELQELANRTIDSNRYMVVGTADEAGHPWVTPVWFASEDYRHFHWVSSPDAKHSGYLASHPEVAIAIFDSSLERGLEVFDRVSQRDIDRAWGLDDVQEPSLFRLYRATVSEHWVLIPGRDPERGSGVDRSEPITL